jgi:glucose/arabinose dehydrogenase/mono/diheme cytochrome c family protein
LKRTIPAFCVLPFVAAILFLQCHSVQDTARPLPAGDSTNGGLILPGGFEALVVVDSIGRARHLAVNSNGDIYVKLVYNEALHGHGGTVALRDETGDGKADVIAYFGAYKDEGGLPAGMSIHDGYLYTSTVRYVIRNKLIPGQLLPDPKTDTLFIDEDSALMHHWHSQKPLAFDNDGHMYIPFGAPDDAGQDILTAGPAGMPGGKGLDPSPDLEWHAGIWQFDAGKRDQTQKDGIKYATGIRSVLGIAWNPADNSLYAVMNGMDNFHTRYPAIYSPWQAAMLPGEPLLKVTKGSDFGWPYAYYDQLQGKNVLQPGYGGDGKTVGRAARFDKPLMAFPGHWAPMDLLFYQGNQFPERYKKGAFVAFHGSTDRSPYPQAGYIVCFVPFENGKPTGKWEVFADGFTGVDTVVNTSDAVYRPMGLAEGPDGSLYICESNKGRIWRVMFKGDAGRFGAGELAKMEARESRTYIKTPDSIKDNMGKGGEMEGHILYGSYCVSCHQRNGKGDNSRYPPLVGSDWVAGDRDRLIRVLLNGLQGEIKVNGKTFNGVMPAHGAFLDDHAIASILTYVKRSFNKDTDPVLSADVTRVRNANAHSK